MFAYSYLRSSPYIFIGYPLDRSRLKNLQRHSPTVTSHMKTHSIHVSLTSTIQDNPSIIPTNYFRQVLLFHTWISQFEYFLHQKQLTIFTSPTGHAFSFAQPFDTTCYQVALWGVIYHSQMCLPLADTNTRFSFPLLAFNKILLRKFILASPLFSTIPHLSL